MFALTVPPARTVLLDRVTVERVAGRRTHVAERVDAVRRLESPDRGLCRRAEIAVRNDVRGEVAEALEQLLEREDLRIRTPESGKSLIFEQLTERGHLVLVRAGHDDIIPWPREPHLRSSGNIEGLRAAVIESPCRGQKEDCDEVACLTPLGMRRHDRFLRAKIIVRSLIRGPLRSLNGDPGKAGGRQIGGRHCKRGRALRQAPCADSEHYGGCRRESRPKKFLCRAHIDTVIS